ncbi:MAG: response regulator transcription factor [Acidobacteriota bacterium]|nr:response regulator transcription factor [Acidobacteriota bacterium]
MSVRPPTRILVAEDDPDIGSLLEHYLRKAGFLPTLVASGRDVIPQIKREAPDLLVLDLMLPGLDGLQLCRAIRGDATMAAIPVIMVTAKGEESDRIVGLELGADDYITKPFSPNEVVARVRALLRRAHRPSPTDSRLTYGVLSVDVDRHVVKVDGREVKLTAKEFLLLQYLMQHRGRVLSRDLLLSDVWSYSYTGGTRTVDVHVRRLRDKVPMLADAIVTVKQFGYKLLDPAPA